MRASRHSSMMIAAGRAVVPALLAAVVGLGAAGPVAAQADDQGAGEPPALEGDQGAEDLLAEMGGGGSGPRIIPIPILFYTPETGLAFGASAIYFLGRGFDPERGPFQSTLSPVVMYTLENQVVVGLGGEVYPAGSRSQYRFGVNYSKFPTQFYGVGNDTPPESEEKYTPEGGSLRASVLRGVTGMFRAGVNVEVEHQAIVEKAEDGQLQTGLVPGSSGGWANGLGLVAIADRRDNLYYPHRGMFFQVGVNSFGSLLGSDFQYSKVLTDLRVYFPLGGEHVIGARAFGTYISGSPPFYRMSMLGGRDILRGYYEGRYRDRQLGAAQLEYRLPLFGRFGLVLFGEVGQVADEFEQFTWTRFYPSGGLGLRFVLSKDQGLRMRMDYGRGEAGASGFYFALGESF